MSNSLSILIVDDEPTFRMRLAKAFAYRGFWVYEGGDYFSALDIIKKHSPDLAIIDLKMPNKTGLALVKDGLDINSKMVAIMLTGYGSIQSATEAIRLGAYNYLPKPADIGDILNAFPKSLKLTDCLRPGDNSPPSLDRTEFEHINRVLKDCDGNISQTAKQLGIHRRTLQRKLHDIQ